MCQRIVGEGLADVLLSFHMQSRAEHGNEGNSNERTSNGLDLYRFSISHHRAPSKPGFCGKKTLDLFESPPPAGGEFPASPQKPGLRGKPPWGPTVRVPFLFGSFFFGQAKKMNK